MTLEVVLIALYRIGGSLPVLRWPLAGGLLAIFVDLTDLYWMNVLDLGGVPNHQLFDKVADQVYLATFLIVAIRWTGPERTISIVLYAFRMAGFVLFELTGERAVLLLFPPRGSWSRSTPSPSYDAPTRPLPEGDVQCHSAVDRDTTIRQVDVEQARR
jgi:hypothetical protein